MEYRIVDKIKDYVESVVPAETTEREGVVKMLTVLFSRRHPRLPQNAFTEEEEVSMAGVTLSEMVVESGHTLPEFLDDFGSKIRTGISNGFSAEAQIELTLNAYKNSRIS